MRKVLDAEAAARELRGWRKSRGKDGRYAVAHGALHNLVDPDHRKTCHYCRVYKRQKRKNRR